jgi:hypothetical protein
MCTRSRLNARSARPLRVHAPDALSLSARYTQIVGVGGVPLPFYKSDTLLLSPGLSPAIWRKARARASCRRARSACLRPPLKLAAERTRAPRC